MGLQGPKKRMRSSKADQWKKATDNEYTAIMNNNTYRLVPLPKDRKSVTKKWIYKIKYNANGTVDCYKALWVARGFTQCKGIDYFKTTSPVVCMENLRLVTGHAMLHHLNIHVVDVKNVFLQADMKEEEMIYVTQPEGYVDSDHPSWVCHFSSLSMGSSKLQECGMRHYTSSSLNPTSTSLTQIPVSS